MSNNSIVKYIDNDEKKLEKTGRKIYKNNNFFKSLADIMEHPIFKNFVKNYIKDQTDLKVVFIFMNMYNYLEEKYNFTSYQKIAIIKKLMSNSVSRQIIFYNFNNLYIDK
tara:strand:+ start:627 stop:956 length:330 start_codon:yes stop_codon:yes gene_type:complete